MIFNITVSAQTLPTSSFEILVLINDVEAAPPLSLFAHAASDRCVSAEDGVCVCVCVEPLVARGHFIGQFYDVHYARLTGTVILSDRSEK